MQVQTVIQALQELQPDSEIMIQWFEKEHVEENLSLKLTDDVWNMAVSLFDKWDSPGTDDFGIRDCVDEAAARIEEDQD